MKFNKNFAGIFLSVSFILAIIFEEFFPLNLIGKLSIGCMILIYSISIGFVLGEGEKQK